jgi:23S rRNA (adenine2503-C2)-methyltransferase
MDSGQFLKAYPRLWGGSLKAYRRLFREGVLEQPGLSVQVAAVTRVLREGHPEGQVIKFVQDLGTGPGAGRERVGLETESVLIPMIGKRGLPTYTLCVSSQVGCAMGCGFCETAQMGLLRSLAPEEIVGQWFAAAHTVGIRPKNLVFMGMGEPLDNLESVIAAIAVLTDTNGPGMAMNKITVSTVGRVSGIRRLAAQVHAPGWHRLGLAVSVNAPNDRIRSELMPVNRRWPMAELRRALLDWPKYGGAKICIEYVLIPGVNDAPEHARELAEWVRPLPACVNLIPYNPRRNSPWPAPKEEQVAEFMAWLGEAGAYVKRRRTKGRDMMGACGQLGNEGIRRRRLVQVGAPPWGGGQEESPV